jgi:hypothetical protein
MRPSQALVRIGALIAVAASVALVPAPAEAASAVRIYRIYYDSPGADYRSNSSLNAEYVMLKNYATTTRYVTNWTIRDVTGYVYKFPTTAIGAGKTVTLHTGKGTNSGSHRYWQRTNYVWNNDRDTAYLRNGSGTLVHTCSYNSSAVDYKNC